MSSQTDDFRANRPYFTRRIVDEILPGLPEPFDCMTVRIAFLNASGLNVDWHEFSAVLDQLNTKGVVQVIRPGGMTGYRLVKPAAK